MPSETSQQPHASKRRAPSGSELATAFDGKLEKRRFSPLYQLGILLVALCMILMPVVYAGIIAGTAWLVWWHMTHSVVMFEAVRGGRAALLIGVIYIAPIIAGGMLILFLLLPAFWKSRKKGPPPYSANPREQQLLYAYVNRLCDTLGAPRPERIDLIPTANASAHVDNGVFGLISRQLVLTVGLPLASAMTLKEFTAVIAHELGHFSQGIFMRLSYVVANINTWFAKLAYSRSGIDDMLAGISEGETHWTIAIIVLLCQLVLVVARLILRLLALISHALSMHLSRQAEFDADWQAARVSGSESMGSALQMLPFLNVGNDMAIDLASQAWKKKALPDDIVLYTNHLSKHMPDKAKNEITAKILESEASWFDTHPPLFKRVAVLKKAKLQGVLKIDAPATILFKDFDELSKMATVDLYVSILGKNLQPEHIVPTQLPTEIKNR